VVCFKARQNVGVLRCSNPKGTTPNKRVQRTAVPENNYLRLFTEADGRCTLRSSHRVSEDGIMPLWWKGMTCFS
jgi:hypothetical protein